MFTLQHSPFQITGFLVLLHIRFGPSAPLPVFLLMFSPSTLLHWFLQKPARHHSNPQPTPDQFWAPERLTQSRPMTGEWRRRGKKSTYDGIRTEPLAQLHVNTLFCSPVTTSWRSTGISNTYLYITVSIVHANILLHSLVCWTTIKLEMWIPTNGFERKSTSGYNMHSM